MLPHQGFDTTLRQADLPLVGRQFRTLARGVGALLAGAASAGFSWYASLFTLAFLFPPALVLYLLASGSLLWSVVRARTWPRTGRRLFLRAVTVGWFVGLLATVWLFHQLSSLNHF